MEGSQISHPLYPFHSVKIGVILVYGTDITRQTNLISIPKWVYIMSILLVLVLITYAAIICALRRKARLRHIGFISSFIDTSMAFLGRGNHRMSNRLERTIFVYLMVAGIITSPIWSGIFVIQTYNVLYQRVKTFKELAATNTPIYISGSLTHHEQNVVQLLKQVLDS